MSTGRALVTNAQSRSRQLYSGLKAASEPRPLFTPHPPLLFYRTSISRESRTVGSPFCFSEKVQEKGLESLREAPPPGNGKAWKSASSNVGDSRVEEGAATCHSEGPSQRDWRNALNCCSYPLLFF